MIMTNTFQCIISEEISRVTDGFVGFKNEESYPTSTSPNTKQPFIFAYYHRTVLFAWVNAQVY